jgi:hypothetical protein
MIRLKIKNRQSAAVAYLEADGQRVENARCLSLQYDGTKAVGTFVITEGGANESSCESGRKVRPDVEQKQELAGSGPSGRADKVADKRATGDAKGIPDQSEDE